MTNLSVENISGGYGDGLVLRDISFAACSGDMVFVLGANGCGKTTLFRIMTSQLTRENGRIHFDGQDVADMTPRQRARKIAYIPQAHVPAFQYTVRDVAAMGRAAYIRPLGTPGNEDWRIVDESLEMFELSDLAHEPYTKISGGQQQLVLIARAICQQAAAIVMDEPLQSLDYVNQAMVMDALRRITKSGRIVVMSTHSVLSSHEAGDKALLMGREGCAVSGGIEDVITRENIQNAYGLPMQVVYTTDDNGGKHVMCVPEKT